MLFPRGFVLSVILAAVLGMSCGSHAGKSIVPQIPGYSDKSKQEFILDDDLLEVSGICYINEHKMAAVNDERGELFIIDLTNGAKTATTFAGKGDYEEVVKADTNFFVLQSRGDIYEVTNTNKKKRYKFDLEKKIEFESMVWYPGRGKLVLISKEQRKRHGGIIAYAFDVATRKFDPEPVFKIPYKDIFTKLEDYSAECKPSGAAINPVNNKLYIIASVGKVLLECDVNGRLERVYKLNPNHFPQPEGISFAANGDMYVSNEGLQGKATILKFPYVASK